MINPTKDEKYSYRVYRGGSWHYSAGNTRVSFYFYYDPAYRGGDMGFRIVKNK